MATAAICAVAGCDKRAHAKGLCRNHRHRQRMHGDPLGGPTADGEPLRWLEDHVKYSEAGPCLIWPFARRSGEYGRFREGNGQTYAHRRMCLLAHGSAPTRDIEVAHSCGNGHLGCVNPHHLRWDTTAGNAADRAAHGTENTGERNGQAKLTEEQVRDIRDQARCETQQQTADRYGICRQTVSDIRRGRRWAFLS